MKGRSQIAVGLLAWVTACALPPEPILLSPDGASQADGAKSDAYPLDAALGDARVGDGSVTTGGAGAGGRGGNGGNAGSAGNSGGAAGTSGNGGGRADASPGDASFATDAPSDMPIDSNDAPTDRASTSDAVADAVTTDRFDPMDAIRDTDVSGHDVTSVDGIVADATSPPDAGIPDVGPPSDVLVEGGGPGDAAAFVLTSTAFTDGTTIPIAHTCAGTNVSPPLSWTPGPPGTMSYAVVLTDKTNSLVHAGIYDIPANVTSLPMDVEKVANPSNPAGSKQVLAYNNMAGYAGPCPGATPHSYEFMLYAVDSAVLPGITTSQKGAALVTALQAHDVATATLMGTATTLR